MNWEHKEKYEHINFSKLFKISQCNNQANKFEPRRFKLITQFKIAL